MGALGFLKKAAGYTPVGAAYNAGDDIYHGKDAGTVAQDLANATPATAIAGYGLKKGYGLYKDATNADTSKSEGLADSLGKERAGFADRAPSTLDQTMADQIRGRQVTSLDDLAAAASGKVPSAAELQLQKQAGIDANRTFGMAAALRGHSPGGALAAATEGAANISAATNQNAGIMRAQEQAQARSTLADALRGTRGQDLTAAGANLDAATKQRLADDEMRKNLLNNQVSLTNGLTQAQIEEMKAKGSLFGGLSSGIASGLSSLSDERAKTDIKRESLADAIGRDVHGVTYTYKPEHEAEGGAGKHFGLLAQDLEKVVPGVVSKGADGLRRVDTGHLTMANTGLISELARRIRKVESRA